MTWVIHKGNRKHLYNLDSCIEISLSDNEILLWYVDRDKIKLTFETDNEATQAFTYLRESIKRGEKLLNI